MSLRDSALNTAALGRARALLKTPRRREGAWRAVGAAALLALSALAFATAMVLAPPVQTEHAVRGAPG